MARKRRASLELGSVGGKTIEVTFGPLPADELVEALFAEASSETPDDAEVAFLAQQLDQLRIDASGGDAHARAALAEIVRAIESEIEAGGVDPGALIVVACAFAQARLDPPPALKAALSAKLEELGEEPELLEAAAGQLEADFAQLAANCGHDPFAIHDQFAQMASAFEGEARAALSVGMVGCDEPAVREAAIGFLLDRDETAAGIAACILAEEGPQKRVSSATIERLVRMRPWVGGVRREGVDAAIRRLRPKAEAPAARAAPELDLCIATLVDGAGAQSLFARARIGKRFALSSVLIKEGAGVADAWVRADLARKDVEAMLGEIGGSVSCGKVSRGFWERRLRDALAVNVAHAPPPFRFVQVAEIAGLGPLPPEPVDVRALADEMLAGLPPSRTDADACAAAARGCRTWDERLDIAHTWFEAGEDVDALLRKLKTRKARIKALCEDHMPKRRAVWAARLAWTAAALRELQADMLLTDWSDMALMARALASGDPCAAPVLDMIAERTADVFAERA